MNEKERERINQLGRLRGEELLATGLMERKREALRRLGWPAAVEAARNRHAASG